MILWVLPKLWSFQNICGHHKCQHLHSQHWECGTSISLKVNNPQRTSPEVVDLAAHAILTWFKGSTTSWPPTEVNVSDIAEQLRSYFQDICAQDPEEGHTLSKVSSKGVPRILSEEQKRFRVQLCQLQAGFWE